MTPAAIIAQAAAAGVNLSVTDIGTIRANGDRDAVAHWLPIIRAGKAELLAHLRYEALPDYLFDEVMPSIRKHGCYPSPAASADVREMRRLHEIQGRELATLAAQDTIADPAGACPACGSGQWWQLPGKPWHCRQCAPMSDDDQRRATTLTLPCHPPA